MIDHMKKRIRRLVKKRGARIPEDSQPGGPGRADEADEVSPPGGYAVPVTKKEKVHDGWTEIRPRRPGEDTDMGPVPDITDPGRDLREEKG
jgi:hypothetical protein